MRHKPDEKYRTHPLEIMQVESNPDRHWRAGRGGKSVYSIYISQTPTTTCPPRYSSLLFTLLGHYFLPNFLLTCILLFVHSLALLLHTNLSTFLPPVHHFITILLPTQSAISPLSTHPPTFLFMCPISIPLPHSKTRLINMSIIFYSGLRTYIV